MRKLIYAINVSLDGLCDHTKGTIDEELMEYYTHLMEEVGLLVFGRKTYQLMVPFWPDIAKKHSESKVENDYADAFASKEILVFSRTLEGPGNNNTRIVRTGLTDEILRLKQEAGKNIYTGGVDIPSQLTELGLVDEFHFVVRPFVEGEGPKLLEGLRNPEKLQLKLAESKIFESGSVALRYVKQ